MILDSLENSKRIECIHPLFKQAFDYVKSTDFSKMEDGKYDIADAGFTVSIASLFGKEKSEANETAQLKAMQHIVSFGSCRIFCAV